MGVMNRRRFISITAAAAGCGLTLSGAIAAVPSQEAVNWRGRALGALASLRIYHPDRAIAERLVRQVIREVDRLEEIFSLYRAESALSQLNRMGALVAPPSDMVAVLETCRNVWELTDGAFDPTVQPLWTVLARHFSDPDADRSDPAPADIRGALELVGFDKVKFDLNRIALSRRGMALTFNGIAQGYITDRAVELLRRGGIEKSMVNLGEIRVTGTKPDGGPWRVAIGNDTFLTDGPEMLKLVDKAVATSSGAGFSFDSAGRFNHLIDPRSGAGSHGNRHVTVVAQDAMRADAYSTAFSLMPREDIRSVLQREHDIEAIISDEGAGMEAPR